MNDLPAIEVDAMRNLAKDSRDPIAAAIWGVGAEIVCLLQALEMSVRGMQRGVMHTCGEGQGPDPMRGDPCPGCEIERLTAELKDSNDTANELERLVSLYGSQRDALVEAAKAISNWIIVDKQNEAGQDIIRLSEALAKIEGDS